MSAPGVFLDRMRANAAQALVEGASLAQVHAHLLAVTRGGNRPSSVEYADAGDVAELVETLNHMRATAPGEVAGDVVRGQV